MAVQILFLLEILVATFALWLGLYATNRDLPWKHDAQPLWKRPPILTGAGLLLASVYLYGNAMKMVATTPEEFAVLAAVHAVGHTHRHRPVPCGRRATDLRRETDAEMGICAAGRRGRDRRVVGGRHPQRVPVR